MLKAHSYPFSYTRHSHEISGTRFCLRGGGVVTPLVLHPKPFTKICHEHHVYVLMHMIKCVDQFLVT